jgi:hypothetical protein
MTATTITTEPPPCPPWCTDTSGHPYSVQDAGVLRDHATHTNPGICQTEYLRGEAVELDPPAVLITGKEYDFMTPEQALEFGDQLIDMARLCRRVAGST